MEAGWTSFSKVSTRVNGAVYDPQGYIWAVTNDSVFRWDIDTADFEDLTPEEGTPGYIKDILLRDGEVWVMANRGVAHYTNSQWEIYELDVDYISRFSDTGDLLWAFTVADYELYYLKKREWQIFLGVF